VALRLRPFITIPQTLRDWTRWIRESALDGTVATANIDDNAITLAKMAQVSTDTLLGRATAGTGNVETVACTSAGRALLDDADASAQRATLGVPLGTSGAVVPLLNGANTHASAKCTLFSVGTATPAGTQAANADTSGAALAALETEVNELKAVLRTFGLIAP
jgi:hypothetical protein